MQVNKLLYFVTVWILVNGQDELEETNPETQNYQFRYFVHDESTGDIKSQEETKQGNVVNGHYSVGEPTGDLRVVTYTADEGGFRANVKYEEGGSPASEDKARQTSAKSGVEFRWLPANPDDIQAGKSSSVEDNSKEPDQNVENGSVESTTESKDQSTSEASNESSTSKSSEAENGEDTAGEKLPKINSAETPSTPASSETSSESTSTSLSTESSEETSMGTSTSAPVENNPTTESEDSAEAAESAPLSEEVLPPLQPPSQMYLPVINYQNLPFLNLPMLENVQDPRESERPPTIIYASQNFYNPWQWFGSNRRVLRDSEFRREYIQKYQDHLAITTGKN